MSQKVYFHNVTQGIYNINDLTDAVEMCELGDDIKFSIRGSALMYDLQTLSDGDDVCREYQYIKDNFCKHFLYFHEENF